MNARKAWTITAAAAIGLVLQHVLGARYPGIQNFNNSVLGRALATILISGAILPQLRTVIQTPISKLRIDRLFRKLLAGDLQLDTPLHKKTFCQLFSGTTIDRTRLLELSPEESACFVLGLQYYFRDVVIDPAVQLFDFTAVAEKAARDSRYRTLLLAHSLNALLFRNDQTPNITRAKNLIDKASGDTRVQHKSEDEDQKLFDRLTSARSERIFISSTTSQVSSAALEHFREFHDKIAELNILMVSPLIDSDPALLRLGQEYDLPDCALPVGQFLPNRTVDYIRRVIRILAALDMLLEFKKSTGIPVRVWLLRKQYLGIKVRVLAERAYMQLLPGSLKYANNIYRFGLEITDKNLIDPFIGAIQRLCEDPDEVTLVPLDALRVNQLRDRALREAAKFFFRSGERLDQIDTLAPQIRFIVKSQRTDHYIEQLKAIVRAMNTAVEHFHIGSEQPATVNGPLEKIWSVPRRADTQSMVAKSVGREKIHVSVGVLLVRDSRVLLIKKRTAPNEGSYSLIAGHVNEGETAIEAMRRELREEMGLTLDEQRCELVRHYPMLQDACRYGARQHEWYVFVSDQAVHDGDIKPDNQEILGFAWEKLEDLTKLQEVTPAAERILADLGLR